MTIKRILFIGICCLCIIPQVILQTSTSFLYQKELENRVIESSQHNLAQIANQLDYMITSMVATANILCNDQEIIDVLEREVPTTQLERFESYKAIRDKISSVASSSLVAYNADIYVLSNDGQTYSINQTTVHEKSIQKIYENKMEEMRTVGTYILWIAPVDPLDSTGIDFSNCVALAKTINDNTTGKVLGAVIINLYIDKNLQKAFSTDYSGTTAELLLQNEKNETIYSTNNLSSNLNASIAEKMTGKSGSFTVSGPDGKQMLDYKLLSRTDWKLVQITSYDALIKDIVLLRNTTLVISVILLAGLLFAGNVFAKNIADPLHELSVLMEQVPEGNFSVRMKNRNGKGEIAQISRSFNKMVNQTEELFTKLENSYRVREELRLSTLRAQVNPHFLFNTLNSIKWLSLMHGDQEVGGMIVSLGNLLQYTLASNNEFVTTAKELECLVDYVKIQKMRFGDKFDLEIDVDEELLSYELPLFILQPIVENSIIHAFPENDKKGIIRIGAEKNSDTVRFLVSDNGCGMKYTEPKDILDDDTRSKGKFSKIGLQNVDERIKIIYGKDYGLSIESHIGVGTDVYLTFPVKRGE